MMAAVPINTASPRIPLVAPPSFSTDDLIVEEDKGDASSKDARGQRRRWNRQRRQVSIWLLIRMTSALKSGVRLGEYCLSNLLMNLLGPILILVVLGMCIILVSSFVNVFYPWLGNAKGLHAAFVCFITTNVMFHYIMCVFTTNSSKTAKFSRAVRELAAATPNYNYPNTSEQLEQAKRDYQETIARRRQQQLSVNHYSWTLLKPTVGVKLLLDVLILLFIRILTDAMVCVLNLHA